MIRRVLAAFLAAMIDSPVWRGPCAGISDRGADVYILEAMSQAGGASDAMDQKCGPVAVKILKNGARRLPGL